MKRDIIFKLNFVNLVLSVITVILLLSKHF